MNHFIIHAANRLEAERQPTRLERARQAQHASQRESHRSDPLRPFRSLLSQVPARFRGMPDRVRVDARAKAGSTAVEEDRPDLTVGTLIDAFPNGAEVDMDGGSGFLVRLDDDRNGSTRVGGKGAGLGRLAALGAPVPPAFCLTTDAYRAMASALGLPVTARGVSDVELPAIRMEIDHSPLPSSIRADLDAGFRSLADSSPEPAAVAVRSSAPPEDGAKLSHAGQYDTVLGVRTPAALESAVRHCWASLWTERAVAYRRRDGDEADDSAIAVVIQRLIPCDVSVVVFTADPVSGDRDRLVIDATWGLGEALVSSLVTPDRVAVDAAGRVTAYAVGTKETMVVPDPEGDGGTRRIPVPRRLRTTPVLTEEQAMAIAAEARSLAGRLGYPIDLEGGLHDGTFYVFQARPITTALAAPAVSPD